MTGEDAQPQLDGKELTDLPEELLDLISVGAGTLLGVAPSPEWGQHSASDLPAGLDHHPDCRTCRASQWFDAAQAELRRRELPAT